MNELPSPSFEDTYSDEIITLTYGQLTKAGLSRKLAKTITKLPKEPYVSFLKIVNDDGLLVMINDVYNNMTKVALKQIEIFYPKLFNGTYDKIKQIEEGNTWRKRNKLDGLIDFRMSTTSIVNLIRALTNPFPGAHCEINGNEYKIWKCEPGSFTLNYLEPGKVLEISNNIIEIKTGDGSIRLTDHELPNLTKGEYIKK